MSYEWGEGLFAPVALTEAEKARRAGQAAAETAARAVGLPEEMVEAFPVGLLREIAEAGPEFAKIPALVAKIRAAAESAFE